MKRVITFMVTAALCFGALCLTAFAGIAPNALNNGTYNIDVESNASMFKVVNCDITVENGAMTALVTLSGKGYGKLFVGTGEQASAAPESQYIPFAENADGQYVYTVPLTSLDTDIAIAAWSTKNEQWYDRTLTFKSDKLPQSAYKTAAPEAPDKENPDTGVNLAIAFGMAAIAASAAAVSRRRSK